MAAFSELIRSFDKIRDYMRDFYVYGFKQRGDFDRKSARTYDNEKRRIESCLRHYVNWSYDRKGKHTFISLDSAGIDTNPLYKAWKSKSFTARDIMLHFYLLDCLRDGSRKTVEEITDGICRQSECTFEVQTVRLKCGEYVREGVLCSEKRGKALCYSLSPDHLDESLLDAVKFYQEAAPFGEIGSYLLDNAGEKNDLFRFKHHYIVHTLENGVLLDILHAMREKKAIRFRNHSTRSGLDTVLSGVPLKIFQSAVTGRRYVCILNPQRRRFINHRLDYIKSVELLETVEDYDALCDALSRSIPLVWGVSFGGKSRKEILCMKLYINEKTEGYVLDRLHRESRDGEVLRMEENLYLYTKELYDTNEMSSWIKTFIGRIVALEGTNRDVINKFYRDIARMKQMYLGEEDT